MKTCYDTLKKILTRLFLRTLGRFIPTDLFAHRFPVSVKGVCIIDDKVVLLKNERNEWDLPGGKLKKGEALEACLTREFAEELAIAVQPQQLLRALTLRIMNTIEIFVIIYSCITQAELKDLRLSEENFALGVFSIHEIDDILLPQAYKDAIQEAYDG